ncbi:hypothetical protein FNV43_RR02472 [Rhamnella rubrinervis]|uniref:EF-hand domain-containing protein n=1 Tax=Rhamnella rubrinervis TaxID=2594499 RepID=A0A8K0HRN9_9ROSA|nr:hypothetical protein FNV43_RR02472 [Rhamnella rubrinervis]
MDTDGDGRVNDWEFTQFLQQNGYNQINPINKFTELDADCDGYLDFMEVLNFYYNFKTQRPWCDGCQENLYGQYFSCGECLGNDNNSTFDLCSPCYTERRFSHHHNQFVDSFVLLRTKRGLSLGTNKIQCFQILELTNTSMDNQVILAAVAYYNNGSMELKERVWEFFKSVDTNRDGRVSFDEFLHFLHLSGYNRVIDPNIFTLLDVHRNGSLEFSEFLTFYYILKDYHRHVRCSYYGADRPAGLYFTGIDCFYDDKTTFDLCAPCINGKRFSHYHGPDHIFHSYVLVPNKREVSHVSNSNIGQAYQTPLFQAPPNHQQMGFSDHQPINSDGSFQYHVAFFNPVAPPVCLNQVPTTNPEASSGCCCGPNNTELMPAAVAYKPSLSKSDKRLKVAKKTGKAVVHCATVVGAGAAILALF